jgi:hypothetical protein
MKKNGGGNSHATAPLRAFNIFLETLNEEFSYNCVQTWYCKIHFVCTDNYFLQELDFT